jgi:SHS2 domain-containing protein
MPARHHIEEHVGELRIRLDAPSREELFVEALRALAQLLAGSRRLPEATTEPVSVRVDAADLTALLVAWLNELIFRSETERRIYVDAHVQHLSDTEIQALVRGAEVDELRTPVKAATYHGLEIKEKSNGVTATVIFDV